MAPKHGLKPEARHVTYVVGGLAGAGNFDDASSLIDAAGNRGWGRTAGKGYGERGGEASGVWAVEGMMLAKPQHSYCAVSDLVSSECCCTRRVHLMLCVLLSVLT